MKTIDIDIFTNGVLTDTSAGAAVVAVSREGLIIKEEALYLVKTSALTKQKFWQLKVLLS